MRAIFALLAALPLLCWGGVSWACTIGPSQKVGVDIGVLPQGITRVNIMRVLPGDVAAPSTPVCMGNPQSRFLDGYTFAAQERMETTVFDQAMRTLSERKKPGVWVVFETALAGEPLRRAYETVKGRLPAHDGYIAVCIITPR